LGEVTSILRGASPRPIHSFISSEKDSVPWIKIGDIGNNDKYVMDTAEKITPSGAKKSRIIHEGDFILSNSMSFGRPYISKITGCIHDGWLSISDFNKSFISDFLYHLLRLQRIQDEWTQRAGSGTVKNLNAGIVKTTLVPVPPLPVQQKIVAVLDKFDALVNDLTMGLPAEIKARCTQYEYYRNQLLTFKERPLPNTH